AGGRGGTEGVSAAGGGEANSGGASGATKTRGAVATRQLRAARPQRRRSGEPLCTRSAGEHARSQTAPFGRTRRRLGGGGLVPVHHVASSGRGGLHVCVAFLGFA